MDFIRWLVFLLAWGLTIRCILFSEKMWFSLDGKYLAAKTRHSNMSQTGMIFMRTSSDSPKYVESAFVMITCEDCTESLMESLRAICEVKEVQPTCGNYDLIVKIEADSAESLREVISLKIRSIEKIRATTTLISSPILVYWIFFEIYWMFWVDLIDKLFILSIQNVFPCLNN